MPAARDGMKIHIEYNAAHYSENFIETFDACYENVLRRLMTKTFVREVELCNAAQIQILDTFNATEVAYDKNQTVVSLFDVAAYVITTADRLADEKSLDVEELLAHGDSTRPQVGNSLDDTSFYTSGTTGNHDCSSQRRQHQGRHSR